MSYLRVIARPEVWTLAVQNRITEETDSSAFVHHDMLTAVKIINQNETLPEMIKTDFCQNFYSGSPSTNLNACKQDVVKDFHKTAEVACHIISLHH